MLRNASFQLAALTATLVLALLAPAARADAPLVVVHVGGVISDDMTPILYAVHEGLFRREGLDVPVVPSMSGTAMTAAVVSGTYEFGKSSILAVINAHVKNIPLAVVAAGGTYTSKVPFALLCVAPDATLAGGKDFNGKTIGLSALNDLNQLVVSAWVDEHGGDATTLRFVELPNSASAAAIAAHRIDAAVILEPALSAAVAAKQVRPLAPALDAIAPTFAFDAFFTSPDFAQRHPDIVTKFVRVLYAAAAFTNKHHAATAQLMADATNIPLPIVERTPRVEAATSLDPTLFQPVIDAAAKYHFVSEAFPAQSMLSSAPQL
jgi:NitT/TauT family transport system substrate-binding protein